MYIFSREMDEFDKFLYFCVEECMLEFHGGFIVLVLTVVVRLFGLTVYSFYYQFEIT